MLNRTNGSVLGALLLGLMVASVAPSREPVTARSEMNGPGQHLLLIGGGNRPPEAMTRFVSWGGGSSSKVLFIAWATEEPDESYAGFVEDITPAHPGSLLWAKEPPKDDASKAEFLSTLKQATAVFFGGGDQNRIFDVLQDAEILHALQARYQAGVPFAGTSAGTAIMSQIAISGGDLETIDGKLVPVRQGLGLLTDIIVDQHFLRRSRENRLFGLILDHPDHLGVGVDQDTSIAIENGRCGEVVGPGDVMLVDALRVPGSLTVTLVKPHEHVDLQKRLKTTPGCP